MKSPYPLPEEGLYQGRMFVELFVSATHSNLRQKVIFDDEQWEEFTEFLEEMFPGVEEGQKWSFVVENNPYTVHEKK